MVLSPMPPAFARLPFPLAALACLALGLTAPACADKGNPVIPTGGGGLTGGGAVTGTSDALSASETGQVVADTAPSTTDVLVLTTCDLLAQNCPKPNGCYPVSGLAMCRLPGSVPTSGSCSFNNNNDQPDCLPGLTCLPSSGLGGDGLCTPICDAQNPTATCGFGILCNQPLPGFPKTGSVGYCQLSF